MGARLHEFRGWNFISNAMTNVESVREKKTATFTLKLQCRPRIVRIIMFSGEANWPRGRTMELAGLVLSQTNHPCLSRLTVNMTILAAS